MLAITAMLMLTQPAAAPMGYTRSDEAAVRKSVYGQRPRTYSPDRDFVSLLEIPKVVRDLYKRHPRGVLNTLLKIAEGAAPFDSTLAVGYALELLEPGAGALCVELYERDSYDVYNKARDATPREHWIAKAKAKLRAK